MPKPNIDPTAIHYPDAPPSIRTQVEALDRIQIRELVAGLIEKSHNIPTTILARGMTIERKTIDEKARTVELSFASEEPVLRWFGWEVLGHKEGEVRLERLNTSGPLLNEHSSDGDNHIGTVERAWIGADRKARALVRFSSAPFAEQVFRDVIDQIKTGVSVLYRIHNMDADGVVDDEPRFRANDWEPIHVSFVAEPADVTVGPGRALRGEDTEAEYTTGIGDEAHLERELEGEPVTAPNIQTRREETMPPKTETDPAAPNARNEETRFTQSDAADARAEARAEASKTETHRLRTLEGLGQKFEKQQDGALNKARQYQEEGKTVRDFQDWLLENLATGTAVPDSVDNPGEIGLSGRETSQFSFIRIINAMAHPTDKRAQEAAAFEFECSRAVADSYGAGEGQWIPLEVLNAPLVDERGTSTWQFKRMKEELARIMSVSIVTTTGADLVATELLASSFIDLLRNRGIVFQRGTIMRDLVGNVDIARLAVGAPAAWQGTEGSALTERTPTIDKVSLVPNTLGAFVKLTRRLMLQGTPDAEAIVRNDLALQLALGIDRAALDGSGSGEPTGILNTTGIGSVASTADEWADMIEFETDVATGNADVGDLAYATNAKVRGLLKATLKTAAVAGYVWEGNQINGYDALVSQQFPSTLGAGSDNLIIFGNWRDVLVGLFGPMDILVDPMTESTSGNTRVTALVEADVALRHPESFSAMDDLTI